MRLLLSPWSRGSESWCTVLIGDNRIIASLKHIGRGRYLILEDKSGGKFAGKVVDASDVKVIKSVASLEEVVIVKVSKDYCAPSPSV